MEYNLSFGDLITLHDGHVTVACDTEYKGPHTLTVQFAARLGGDIVVQVYSSPAIPEQPDAETLLRLLPPGIETPGRKVIIREGRRIRADLSPGRVLDDLFDLGGVEASARSVEDGTEDVEGTLTLTLVGHFWPADFFRVFGSDFFQTLLAHQLKGGNLLIQAHRLLAFKEARGYRAADPILGYAWKSCGLDERGFLYAIRVNYFDTWLAFGNRPSLEDLAATFVGVKKLEGFGQAAKEDMLATFRREPARAYAYAINDSVLTLLVKEGMADTHAKMYRTLGFAGEDIPPLRSTQGSRVAELIVRSVAQPAAGSAVLSRKTKKRASDEPGKVALGKVRALLHGGSGDFITGERLSWFGEQTGQTHGGLCFSRSPTQLFHAATGMFRDVDLSGCYAQVMGSMSLYAGRPVIHEPGSGRLKLKDAVAFVTQHAAGWDAWIIKVSGKITAWPNVLIPSTKAALHNGNYKSRAAKRRAERQWAKAGRLVFPFDWRDESRKDDGNTSMYTDVIEAGVVAWPTWLMIQALPPEWRKEYEDLEVDTLIFYPRQMVADSGPEFDALVHKYRHDGTPWQASIDMHGPDGFIHQLIDCRVDEEYVAFRFDIGKLASAIQRHRQEAKELHGKGKAAERGWKETVNSMYGVLASRHLATNNVVAANVITATARALAFGMQMSLNGVQVVTDGCTYRLDQVPGRTLADCLADFHDYPINRAGFRGPVLDPAAIPTDDAAFTEWYRGHVKRFFGIEGLEYDWFFGLHKLEHKTCGEPESASFDALCCDGSANYIKLVQDGAGGWAPAGKLKDAFKARSFGEQAKADSLPWLIRAYSQDRYDGPPPIAEASNLMKYKDAGRAARTALRQLEREQPARWLDGQWLQAVVYFPLGVERRRPSAYKVLKLSAFLFQAPQQQAAYKRALEKFGKLTSCGLELLALRKGGKRRRHGSIADVATTVYRLIRSGEMNPTKALNLNRSSEEREEVNSTHHDVLQALKVILEEGLARTLNARKMDKTILLTGLYVDLTDLCRLAAASAPAS
jgi:hypothetical protein